MATLGSSIQISVCNISNQVKYSRVWKWIRLRIRTVPQWVWHWFCLLHGESDPSPAKIDWSIMSSKYHGICFWYRLINNLENEPTSWSFLLTWRCGFPTLELAGKLLPTPYRWPEPWSSCGCSRSSVWAWPQDSRWISHDSWGGPVGSVFSF